MQRFIKDCERDSGAWGTPAAGGVHCQVVKLGEDKKLLMMAVHGSIEGWV